LRYKRFNRPNLNIQYQPKMKIINPSEISGKIMNLFDEARKFIVIVSPYYNFGNWKKLIKRLDAAKQKKIQIEFYVRAGEQKSIEEVYNLGL
jgi:hypothetical protein